MSNDYEVRIGPLPEIGRLHDTWIELQKRSKASYFLSWAWIGTWLELICDGNRAQLVSVSRGAIIVGLGVVTARRRFMDLGPLHIRLHEVGDPILDNLTIEYNGLLTEAGHEKSVLAAVVKHLAQHDKRWLTFYLPGLDVENLDLERLQSDALELRTHLRATHYVDLGHLRTTGHEYITALPAQTRNTIRGTQRKLEQNFGEISVETADTHARKREFFDELVRLHQASWIAKGSPGAFSDPRILQFHDRLIAASSADEGVQFVRLDAGSRSIGYIYNIVWRKRVYYYQAGIDYAGCGHLGSPGLLLLAHAVQRALADGMDRYEFRAGDAFYKRKLGNREGRMAWVSVDRIGWASRARHVWWSIKRSSSR